MSAALSYVEKLRTAPDGRAVTPEEKALLHVLAGWHNVKEGGAWPRTAKLAETLGISESQAGRRLASCVAKGIIWRRQRFTTAGQQISNLWKFTALDGPEPDADRQASDQLRARGQAGRTKQLAARPASEISTASTEGDPHPCGTGTRTHAGPRTRTHAGRGPAPVRPLDPLIDQECTGNQDPEVVVATAVQNVENQRLLQIAQDKLLQLRKRAQRHPQDIAQADFSGLLKEATGD